MTSTPAISVVLPVYNAGSYLIDAVASVMAQSFEDWEMICVNDGSSDQSGPVLDWFARQDPRVRVVHQENAGLVGALNVGCGLSRAPLIMRMDNDDIALPDRMAVQLEFMSQHPECVVAGGAILEMDSEAAPLGTSSLAAAHETIVDDLLHRRTGHFHPTTLIRRTALQGVGGYRREYEWVEDHDLWLRLSQCGQLANIEEVVLCYRQHAQSICWQRSNQQRELMNSLLREAYAVRGKSLPSEVILSESTRRSAAGPGKWARAAAKGGYPRSAFKHLGQLNISDSAWSYKLRMNLEVLSRLGMQSVNRRGGYSIPIPQFPEWHQRWESERSAGCRQYVA